MKTGKLSFLLGLFAAIIFATSCSDYDNGYTEKTIRYERAFLDIFGEIDPEQDWNLVKQLREQEKGTRASRPEVSDNPLNDRSVYQPEGFSDNQKEIVRLFFQNNKYLKGISYPYDEFFAQQIYTGHSNVGTDVGSAPDCKEIYYTADGQECGSNKMDHFTVGPAGNQFHIDSFNNGRYNRGNANGIYADNADTSVFGYTNSAVGFVEGNYIVIDGATIDAWAKGAGASILQSLGIPFESVASSTSVTPDGEQKVIKRYFLGFDYALLEGDVLYSGRSITIGGEDYPCLSENENMYAGEKIIIENYDRAKAYWNDPDNFPDADKQTYAKDIELLRYCMDNGYLPVGDRNQWTKVGTTRDGYFSDWVISITSGKYGEDITTERVFESALLVCEDLGDCDFDFNDIVLKLEHKRTTTPIMGEEPVVTDNLVITAMAAGGTLPSYVYYKPLRQVSYDSESTEKWLWLWAPYAEDDNTMSNCIHHMVGGEEGNLVPLNVGPQFTGEGHSWSLDITEAIKVIENSTDESIRKYVNSYVSYIFDFSRIRIYVGEEMDETNPNQTYIEPIVHGIDNYAESSAYKTANIPQMLLLPEYFEWAQECVPIADAYTYFREWVRKKSYTSWFLTKDANLVTLRTGNGGGSTTEPIDITEYVKKGTIPASLFTNLQSKVTINVKISSNNGCNVHFYRTAEYDWGNVQTDINGYDWLEPGTEKTYSFQFSNDDIKMIKKYGIGIIGDNIEYIDIKIE